MIARGHRRAGVAVAAVYDESELAVTIFDHTLAVVGTRTEQKGAEYGKGVLALHVPRVAGPKPRTVTIARKKK